MKLSKEFIAMFREEAKRAQWEINRWNGKSIDDLVVDYIERKELKPEDFTGTVVLTVEEAQLCLKLAIGSLIVPFGNGEPPKWVKEAIEMLRKRIKQAEGKQ